MHNKFSMDLMPRNKHKSKTTCARPELVEGFLRALERNPSTSSGRAQRESDRWRKIYCIFLLSFFYVNLTHSQPRLMDFSVVDISDTTKELTITFIVPQKDYIYKDFITCSVNNPFVTITPWKANRETVNHYDLSFKETKQVFNETFSITIMATTTKNPASAHLYCSYYRQAEKKINQAFFPFSFAEPMRDSTPSSETTLGELPVTQKVMPSYGPFLHDYYCDLLSFIATCVVSLRINYKKYIAALFFLIIILFLLSHFAQQRLLRYRQLQEFIELSLALLITLGMMYVLIHSYTIDNALSILIISCISCCSAGLFYIQKSTKLITQSLRTLCSCIGIILITSSIIVAFKLLQCVDEKFDLFL